MRQIYDLPAHEDSLDSKNISPELVLDFKPKIGENRGIIQISALNLDTLAQGVTSPQKTPILKRARRKFISQALALKLVDIESSPLKGAYWNTYHCGNVIHQKEHTLTSRYCNGRWCGVCNAIRTRNLIIGYEASLKALQASFFVTLTIVSIPAHELSNALDGMLRTFQVIAQKFKTRRYRNTSMSQLVGIRKTEVTYNAITNTYHPHYHCIIEGEVMATALVTEWLARYPTASIKAQRVIPVTDGIVHELFKYVTKIVTKSKGKTKVTPIKALDLIFSAMKGRQIFKAFGIPKLREVSEDIDQIQAQEHTEIKHVTYDMWQYVTHVHDWINEDGEFLTGYKPLQADIDAISNF